jgi:hypothetical protein
LGVPQVGQRATSGDAHSPQYLRPDSFSTPQLEQITADLPIPVSPGRSASVADGGRTE